MKIAISTTGQDLDTEIDPRFGRCQYFLIVDPDTMEYEAVQNRGASAGGGAGIATAQTVAGKGAEVILTGNCGPNAFGALNTAGISVVTGLSGKVRDAITGYKAGEYQPSSQPSVSGHHGLGR